MAWVEHGPTARGTSTGCSIDHAHLHLIPWTGKLRSFVDAECRGIEWRSIGGLNALSSRDVLSDAYLFIDTAYEGPILGSRSDFPSQLIRRAIASALGKPQRYDWRRYPTESGVRRTLNALG
jgi:ATP adenylyltransferase